MVIGYHAIQDTSETLNLEEFNPNIIACDFPASALRFCRPFGYRLVSEKQRVRSQTVQWIRRYPAI